MITETSTHYEPRIVDDDDDDRLAAPELLRAAIPMTQDAKLRNILVLIASAYEKNPFIRTIN